MHKLIVSLDPSGAAKSGITIRTVPQIPTDEWPSPVDHPPLYIRALSIWDDSAYKLVGDCVGKYCNPGDSVLYVAESDAFGGLHIAKSLGTAVGCLEGLLIDLNVFKHGDRIDVKSNVWRKAAFGALPRSVKRKRLKELAVDLVEERYGKRVPVDAAESCLINDWAYTSRKIRGELEGK